MHEKGHRMHFNIMVVFLYTRIEEAADAKKQYFKPGERRKARKSCEKGQKKPFYRAFPGEANGNNFVTTLDGEGETF